MAEPPKIQCLPDGPFLMDGPLEVLDPTGKTILIEAGKKAALCRCGASKTKPFCDGAHRKAGFRASEPAPAEKG